MKHTGRLLVGAGLLIWAIVAAQTLSGDWSSWRSWAAAGALVAWAAAFAASTRERPGGDLSPRATAIALAVQNAAALGLCALGMRAGALLLAPVAAQLPFVVSPRATALWLGVQALALAPLFVAQLAWRPALLNLGAQLALQLFAIGAAMLAVRESRARHELEAAQHLLADSSRLAERLRIARELHDSMGHHLAALGLQLELAGQLAEGRAAEPVRQARDIARRMMGEVREVVGALREEAPVDLDATLRALAQSVGRPRIHLAVPAGLRLDAARSHALFRCVQEAVTNSVRHAAASNLWIDVVDAPGGVEMRARDDGRGAAQVRPGHGLGGMSERLAEMGGALTWEAEPGKGFRLRAFLPAPGATP